MTGTNQSYHIRPTSFNLYSSSTQAPSKSNKMTRISHLKGSRKLQNFGFAGGIISGTSGGGGSGTGSGSASVEDAGVVGVADGTGSGEFTATTGSSGFIDTMLSSATGNLLEAPLAHKLETLASRREDLEPSLLRALLNLPELA
jgi:hypothetical protein